MKRYLVIVLSVLFFAPLSTAQVVKRTTKTPNFFVPNSVLTDQNKKENLSVQKPLRITGGMGSVSNGVIPSVRQQYPKAPVSDILQKQNNVSQTDKQRYIKSVVSSFTIYPNDLEQLLQAEFDTVNRETIRMKNIMQNLKNSSPAYQFANFELKRQISQDMTKNRRHYKKIKQSLTEIINKTPPNKQIYIAEAKNNLFWEKYELVKTLTAKNIFGNFHFYTSNHFKDVTYISIFNYEYKHIFSYYRQHLDMLKQKKIMAPHQVGRFQIGQREINIYQQLFNNYLIDLNRIGKGLDITNPQLLRQLNEMQNRQMSI